MNPTQMIRDAEEAISQCESMRSMVAPGFFNENKDFPDCDTVWGRVEASTDVSVWSYDPKQVLRWMKNNGLYDGEI
jgi:hypothetical protein